MRNPQLLTSRTRSLARMEATGLVAIIRASADLAGHDELVDTCKALRDGGVEVTEITMTTPGALQAIEAAAQALGPDACIGAGSVLDGPTCLAAIRAGAEFIVSPVLNLDVVQTAHRYGKAVIPAGLTPTEILTAFQAGADLVKVFPANHFGPTYLKDLLAPMPQLRLIPTGGVRLNNLHEWLQAGAACLGVGTSLVQKELIAARDWPGLTKLARQWVEAVQTARSGK
ncbi:MAG: bifunctional 4-hydroxy-2-oxoglutarate aldolase/2-dehydro-3-deoxy-phosphogluconate aldolase [Phycisphaeraceae bacterium]|nr:bifunctional 4-hydroxy-2-oxoglutarate aldolase/2-dehydro-3-deoxy-phosphogluconate aldolase [Phycisphaeraceae bacterium]